MVLYFNILFITADTFRGNVSSTITNVLLSFHLIVLELYYDKTTWYFSVQEKIENYVSSSTPVFLKLCGVNTQTCNNG
jgi:hypothetical protein